MGRNCVERWRKGKEWNNLCQVPLPQMANRAQWLAVFRNNISPPPLSLVQPRRRRRRRRRLLPFQRLLSVFSSTCDFSPPPGLTTTTIHIFIDTPSFHHRCLQNILRRLALLSVHLFSVWTLCPGCPPTSSPLTRRSDRTLPSRNTRFAAHDTTTRLLSSFSFKSFSFFLSLLSTSHFSSLEMALKRINKELSDLGRWVAFFSLAIFGVPPPPPSPTTPAGRAASWFRSLSAPAKASCGSAEDNDY